MKAVAPYDANSGRGFVVFAMPVIMGAITVTSETKFGPHESPGN